MLVEGTRCAMNLASRFFNHCSIAAKTIAKQSPFVSKDQVWRRNSSAHSCDFSLLFAMQCCGVYTVLSPAVGCDRQASVNTVHSLYSALLIEHVGGCVLLLLSLKCTLLQAKASVCLCFYLSFILFFKSFFLDKPLQNLLALHWPAQ